jgi:murein DD-endopeptidase MepM/ murein hydrolase activator NlpD
VLANLEPTDEDVLQVGIGGPTIGGRADLLARPTVLPEGPRQVDAAREDLETLSRQARLLEESFSEVLDALKSRKQELAHVPSIMPVENCWITTRFGYRSDPFTGKRVMHYGVDLSARRGEPVVAAADGKVTFARKFGYLGLTVEIDHGNGIKTRYGHSHRIFVKQGQEVVRGQVIAAVGSSGRSTGPHLHYEVRLNDRSVDPAAYMIAP